MFIACSSPWRQLCDETLGPWGRGELRTSYHWLPTAPDLGPYDPKNLLKMKISTKLLSTLPGPLGPQTFLNLNALTSDHWFPAAPDPGPLDLVTECDKNAFRFFLCSRPKFKGVLARVVGQANACTEVTSGELSFRCKRPRPSIANQHFSICFRLALVLVPAPACLIPRLMSKSADLDGRLSPRVSNRVGLEETQSWATRSSSITSKRT